MRRQGRRSIRLQGFDYSSPGAYFVTICVQHRQCLFGNVTDHQMVLNDAGQMVASWYRELENKFPGISCDAFVCMPNHVHFVLMIVDQPQGGHIGHPRGGHVGHPQGGHIGPPLHAVVQWFKTMSTNEYIRGVQKSGWPRFSGKLWQRNYWERVVRNEAELASLREYIHNNPAKWALDKLYVPQPLAKGVT